MTAAYDLELVAAKCEQLSAAIAAALRHPQPDWLQHRLVTLRTEADGTRREILNHKEGHQ